MTYKSYLCRVGAVGRRVVVLLVVVERGRFGGGGRVQGRFRVQDLDVVGDALRRPRLGGGVVEGLRRRMVDGVGRRMVMVIWLLGRLNI